MTNFEKTKHFVLDCEISDFSKRFSTESVEIGGCLCNSIWEINFYPKSLYKHDKFVMCSLVRLSGGPNFSLKLHYKFEFLLPNGCMLCDTGYQTFRFAQIYSEAPCRIAITTDMLAEMKNRGFNKLIFRCLIKDQYSLDPNRKTWFSLLQATECD